MNVPPSKKATLYIETASQAIFEQSTAFLTRLAGADQIVMGSPEDLKGCVQVITDSAKVYMPLSQLVDRDKEIARLTKEKQACEKDISFLEGKLNNPGFVSKAPEKVVNDQKAKLEKAKELLSKIVEPCSFQQLNAPLWKKKAPERDCVPALLCWFKD